MTNKITLAIIVFIIIATLAMLFFPFLPTNEPYKQACINSECFDLEIAVSSKDRQQGLMYRESLQINSGMLFIFPEETKQAFWMKNTLIPLDIIWINSEQQIVHIQHATPPCEVDPCPTYKPRNNAKYVLEINANLAKQHNIKEGDTLLFK
jgi:uncharacterized protein